MAKYKSLKVKNNADDIVELNGEAYKPEVIEHKKINGMSRLFL